MTSYGVGSLFTFEETLEYLKKEGVNESDLDFIVVCSGSGIYVKKDVESGTLSYDDRYGKDGSLPTVCFIV